MAFDDAEGVSVDVVGQDYVVEHAALSNVVDFGVVGDGVGAEVVFFEVHEEGELVEERAGLFAVALVEEEGVLDGDGFLFEATVNFVEPPWAFDVVADEPVAFLIYCHWSFSLLRCW